MKFKLLLIIVLFSAGTSAQNSPVGIFRNASDIGNPGLKGSAVYNPVNQEYTIKGGGYNIWFERDEFYFLFNKIKGDFIITANFAFKGEGKVLHRKTGIMIRESDAGNASHISATLHGDGLTVLQWREIKGAFMRDPQDEIFPMKKNFEILQIERTGKRITMRASHPGEPLQIVGYHDMVDLKEEVLAGVFVCSHDPAVVEEARIWNVRIDKPVSDNYNPGKEGWLGCRMEILDVFNGIRKVIYEKNGRFEAPNWMPDGKKLLFNMNGSIYKIPVEGGEPEKLNTGFADNINNDHGISFDGKMLAISHGRAGLPGGGSSVYVLPLEGGTPKLITDDTPSYWHGWSPDNKKLIYVAQRNNIPIYNIYSNSINGGNEVALTANKAGDHVDGCEFSPDGKFIYFNASYSGTMQIWRMKPDGSGREQLTFDEYNDWFPHISPDGKWIVFISFLPEIDVNSHPSYKRVMLKIMPSSGGAPRVIAYLYGGQGTINVPSWSPDSRNIAFVSNSGKE
jgi:TolB protein